MIYRMEDVKVMLRTILAFLVSVSVTILKVNAELVQPKKKTVQLGVLKRVV
jgi:hypothetical protein